MQKQAHRIRVLYVDDDEELVDVTVTYLERENSRFEVVGATSAREGMEILEREQVDCVVSDYEMPDQSGLDFLEAVREVEAELPFILYTGRGSEEVASEAISAGITDYLQKRVGLGQYAVLANRIEIAVEAHRSTRAAERQRHWLEQLLKTVPTAVIEIDRDGQVVSANHLAEEELGLERTEGGDWRYDDAEWTALDSDGTALPDGEQPFRRIYETREPVRNVRYVLTWPEGIEKIFSANAAPLFDNDGEVESVLVALVEITGVVPEGADLEEADPGGRDRRPAVDRENQSLGSDSGPREPEGDSGGGEDPTSELLNAFRDILFVLDEQGELAGWNDRLAAVTGYSDEELDGRHAVDFFGPDLRRQVEKALDDLRETGSARGELPVRTKAGDAIPYEFNAVALGDPQGRRRVAGIARDVSLRQERERKLEEERDHFTTLFENLPNPVVQGKLVGTTAFVIDVNPAFEETFGVEAEEIEGDRLHDHVLGERHSLSDDVEPLIRELYETGELHVEATRETAEGEREFRIDGAVRTPESEQPDGYAVYTDVTELQHQKRRLEEFASVVSHDLRNPLNIAISQLELVRSEVDLDGLEKVARAHRRMKQLIDDVLALAREGEVVEEPHPVDLERSLRTAANHIEMPEVEIDADTDGPILADERRLVRLFENLLRNVVEHAGPNVTVSLGDLPDGFYLEDDGVGIPEEERDEIFETGYSRNRTGTGFGLSIVREIAEAHGWNVRATDSDEGGARFEITGVSTADA